MKNYNDYIDVLPDRIYAVLNKKYKAQLTECVPSFYDKFKGVIKECDTISTVQESVDMDMIKKILIQIWEIIESILNSKKLAQTLSKSLTQIKENTAQLFLNFDFEVPKQSNTQIFSNTNILKALKVYAEKEFDLLKLLLLYMIFNNNAKTYSLITERIDEFKDFALI